MRRWRQTYQPKNRMNKKGKKEKKEKKKKNELQVANCFIMTPALRRFAKSTQNLPLISACLILT